jgi:opacity protein-like surface antigen
LNGASEHNARSRISPGIQFLVRDNIKAEFEYQYRWKQPDPTTNLFFRANGFTAGIDYVF